MMTSEESGHLILLTGPSCVGKTPLVESLAKFFPQVYNRMKMLVLYNDRQPRPGEEDGVDYYFRTRDQIKSFHEDDNFIVVDVRRDIHALNIQELLEMLKNSDVLYEGNPYVSRALQNHPRLKGISRKSVFLSPLSEEEIKFLLTQKDTVVLEKFVTEVMRRKLLRRIKRQKNEISLNDLRDIEVRASNAYQELKMAWHFDYVIPNHDGEDSDNWKAFYYPIGEARKTLLTLVNLIENRSTENVETWKSSLIP